MNRKDFMKGLLAVACGASVVSAIGAQYNAEQPEPKYTPEDTNANEMTAAEVERIGKEELYVRKAYAERYKMMYATTATTSGDNASYVCSGRFVQLNNDTHTWIWKSNDQLIWDQQPADMNCKIL